MDVDENFDEFSGNDEKSLEILQEIIGLLRHTPEGISQMSLLEKLKKHDRVLIVKALNILFEENKIIIENSKTDGNILKLLTDKDVLKIKDLSGEELKVYQIIIGTGGNGISLNELKNQIGITGTALQKIRKRLEKKLLIKNITVPNMKNKKVILGYDTEPNNELKGGFWCTNQQFDQDLISTISMKCIDYLKDHQSGATRSEVLLMIKKTNISKITDEIREDDLQKILNILVFDDKLDIIGCDNMVLDNKYSLLLKKDQLLTQIKYKYVDDIFEDFSAIESTPCSYCEVFENCSKNCNITPDNCPHLEQMYEDLF